MATFLKESFGFSLLIWYIILLPYLSYYLLKYRQNVNDSLIRPRHPRLALLSNYFLMILLFVIAPLQWAEIIFFDATTFGKMREYFFVFRVIWEQLSMWMRVVRYWHIWYKFHYQRHCALSVYKKAISGSTHKESNNYFVKYKHTMGNIKYCFAVILCIWFFEMIVFITSLHMFEHEQHYHYKIIAKIGFIFYLFQCIVFIALSISINQIRDALYIRSEIFYESIAALFSCLVLFTILICLNVPTLNEYVMSNEYFISIAMFIFPGFVCYPLMIYMTSAWVYIKAKNQNNAKQMEVSNKLSIGSNALPSMTTDTPHTNRSSISMANFSTIDDKIDPRLKSGSLSAKSSRNSMSRRSSMGRTNLLKSFLSNTIGFELFAEHLIKEYSIENLLFLIEVEAFKTNCKKEFDKLHIDHQKLPTSLPKSDGLSKFNGQLKLQFCVLYHKYIDSNKAEEFGVNVASRNKLICQHLYNEWYESAHTAIDCDSETDSSQSETELCEVSQPNARKSVIIGFRDRSDAKEEQRALKEEQEDDNGYVSQTETESKTRTTSIVPPITSYNSKYSLNLYAAVPSNKRLSTTVDITATPSSYPPIPPVLTINVDEHSFDQRTQCELTDNYINTSPAPQTTLSNPSPQITPATTPQPPEDDTIDKNEYKTPDTLQPLSQQNVLEPISPLSLSSQKMSNKILSTSIEEASPFKSMIIGNGSENKNYFYSKLGRASVSQSSSTAISNYNSSVPFEEDGADTPIPGNVDMNELEKQRQRFNSRASITAKRCFQKRSSASLQGLVNRVPRNVFTERIEEMMALMNDNDDDDSAKEILDNYVDNMEDTQAMIDALECCLKDVWANMRDSFGRFVLSDAYKRWCEHNIL